MNHHKSQDDPICKLDHTGMLIIWLSPWHTKFIGTQIDVEFHFLAANTACPLGNVPGSLLSAQLALGMDMFQMAEVAPAGVKRLNRCSNDVEEEPFTKRPGTVNH